MTSTNRIILLIDMDCFYCQVEENLNPHFKGKPLAVVQYNQWRGGGIIAVNYPARDRGVTRHMRGNQAKEKCPEIILAKVPEVRGKADLTKYREAGKLVAKVLQTFTPYLERASVDEAYLDITDVVEKRIQEKNDVITVEKLLNSFVVASTIADFVENVTKHRHYDEANFRLALGGVIAEEIREEVYKVTGYRCSAGVAHNKILAKLVCGLHKPNKQTILPHEAVPHLYQNLPVKKIKSLGGKFGDSVVGKLNIEFMGELVKFSQKELMKKFDEKSASWLYNIARGIDTEPVNTRLISKSIGCCKRFPGRTALRTKEDIQHWLGELAEEIFERLEQDFEENNRKARQMVISFTQEVGDDEVHSSKTHPLNAYDQQRIFEGAFNIVQKNCMKDDGSYHVTFLGISVSSFQDVKKVKEITSFFQNMRDNLSKKQKLGHSTDNALIFKSTEENIKDDKMVEHFEESTDDSVYSQTTEEDQHASYENLVFYEQVYPESMIAADQNINFDTVDVKTAEFEAKVPEDLHSDDSQYSLSNEVTFEDDSSEKPHNKSGSSFFTKYFSGNLHRNFNTSKTLSTSEEVEVDTNNEETDHHQQEDSEKPWSVHEVCPQCGKSVHIMELQSHQDYHFALSIVKEEAHLYKNGSSSGPVKTVSPGSNKKRKKNDVATSNVKKNAIASHSSNSIVNFFKSCSKVDEVSTRACEDCGRRIALNEWDVHLDYHAAKKLHLQMNPVPKKTSVASVVKQKSIKHPSKGQKNIIGFLKPS